MPDVVLPENLIGVSRVEAVDEVGIPTDAFERILATALPSDDSPALIARPGENRT